MQQLDAESWPFPCEYLSCSTAASSAQLNSADRDALLLRLCCRVVAKLGLLFGTLSIVVCGLICVYCLQAIVWTSVVTNRRGKALRLGARRESSDAAIHATFDEYIILHKNTEFPFGRSVSRAPDSSLLSSFLALSLSPSCQRQRCSPAQSRTVTSSASTSGSVAASPCSSPSPWRTQACWWCTSS